MAMRRKGKMVEWKVTVPEITAAKVELILMDPVYGKPRYGARSQLITQLLNNLIAQHEEENPKITKSFVTHTPTPTPEDA